MIRPIVSPEWLNDNINDPDLIILDASNSSNVAGLNSKYENYKIPYSQHFNLKENFSKQNSQFPNTFPSTSQFERESRKLGISNSSKIVVYDNLGIYLSPRVWWMFKTMGHEQVFVLDGGLPSWISNDFKTVQEYIKPKNIGNFTANINTSNIKSLEFIRSNITNQKNIIVDARSSDRFNGVQIEPRKGLRSGHIPNSINLPFTEVLNGFQYKTPAEIKNIFEKIGIDERPITFSCGSGVTACILLLAADITLKNPTSIYDGSWTEYGSLIETDH